MKEESRRSREREKGDERRKRGNERRITEKIDIVDVKLYENEQIYEKRKKEEEKP